MNADEHPLFPSSGPEKAAFEIQDWPFYHLVRVTAAYTQRMDASLKPLGVDVPRWRVLAILHNKGICTVTQLSVEAVTKMSTMAKIVQRMIGEGLVSTQVSAEDGRSTEVLITDQGQALYQLVQTKVSRIGREAFLDVTDTEIHELNSICRRLYANLMP